MHLLRLLIWIRMYQRNAFLNHLPMIMVVYGYNPVRKSSMASFDWRWWVPICLCENPSCSSPKESVPDFIDFIVIWDVIFVLGLSTHTVLTGVSSDVSGYEYSLVMMSVHICTGQRCLPVCHWVIVEFSAPFLCVPNIGETLSARWIRPLLCVSLHCFM